MGGSDWERSQALERAGGGKAFEYEQGQILTLLDALWTAAQGRLCAPFHTPRLGHTSGVRWGKGNTGVGSPEEALGFYHIPSVTSFLKKERCHICSFSVNIF